VGSLNKKTFVGFDLGGTKMMAVAVDDNFKILGRERKKTKSQDSKVVEIDRIVKTIRTALEVSKIDSKEISAIGMSLPGALDLETGIVIDAPNLGWHNIPIQKQLQTEFSCPVIIINDVDAGVYGEYKLGAAKNARCVFGIFPGTGIGGGCVYKGELFRGKNQSCMEIGHMQMIPDGPLCGCGRRGCLESLASRLAISAAAAIAVFRGDAPVLSRLCGTDLSNIRSGALCEAIKNGDTVIEQIVRQSASWIGRASAAVVNLLAPDVLLLGGGLVEAMPDLFSKEVEKTARSSVMPAFEKIFKVVTAQLGDDASALGSAAWANYITTGVSK
jgi:glucokinase